MSRRAVLTANQDIVKRFEHAVAPFDDDPDVSAGTGFGGSPGRRVGGRIFAMLVNEALVVKLSADRVSTLIAAGRASTFDGGKGKPMREWAVVPAGSPDDWPQIVAEAHAFAAGRSTKESR